MSDGEQMTTLPSIAHLSQAIFNAVASEEANNSLEIRDGEIATTRLHDFELMTVLGRIKDSEDIKQRLVAAMICLKESAQHEDPMRLFSDVAAIYIDGFRNGWHSRGSLFEADRLRQVHTLEKRDSASAENPPELSEGGV
jgi:hypothetical protein